MPTYDYKCKACDHTFELFQSMTAKHEKKCPACGKLKLERLIGTGAALIFKGGGFYQTDYRTESYKQGESAAKDAGKPADAAGKSESKPDSKPDSKSESKADTKPAAPAATKAEPKAETKPAAKVESKSSGAEGKSKNAGKGSRG